MGAARISKLRTRAAQQRQRDIPTLRQGLLDFVAAVPEAERPASALMALMDREVAAYNGWTFVMISADANDAVSDWLFFNAERPMVAVRLWLKLFKYLNRDTGEIMLSRREMADAVETRVQEVSQIMSQLEGIGAISRRKAGREVRYYMSPLAGTHLAGPARVTAQAAAPELRLVVSRSVNADAVKTRPKRA